MGQLLQRFFLNLLRGNSVMLTTRGQDSNTPQTVVDGVFWFAKYLVLSFFIRSVFNDSTPWNVTLWLKNATLALWWNDEWIFFWQSRTFSANAWVLQFMLYVLIGCGYLVSRYCEQQVDNFEFFDIRWIILCWKDFKLLDQGFPAGWTPPPAMMKMERFEIFFQKLERSSILSLYNKINLHSR